MIGATLSHFHIKAKLGEGGMGEVYRAEDTKLGREVAIKVLPKASSEEPERLARFEREAKVLATLNHPNVAAIYEVGEAGAAPYLVMELVDGDTLDKFIPMNGLDLSRFFELATPLADAIAAAHDKGVTHRDLKPANVMVTPEGRLKVLDFGLAKLRHIGGDDDERTRTLPDSVTTEGTIVGTVSYMSPEQAEGKPIDHRTDIFSLGVVLYEMATGRRPFAGDSTLSTLSAILRDDPRSVTELRQDLPRHLGRIITHCLQKDPQRRYQSARDITNELLELEREAASGDLSETSLPPRRRASSLVKGAAAAAMIAVGAALFFWLRPPATSDPLPTLGVATRVTAGDGLATHGAISPDGSLVAFAAGQATQMRVYIQPVGGGRTITLSEESTAFEYQPLWSPDGTQILYLTPEGARVSSSLGGTSRLVAGASDEAGPFASASGPLPAVSAAAWSPDGKRVFIGRGGALSIVPLAGGAELQLGVLPYEIHSCDWSPLGRWVACTSGNWESVVPSHNYANIAPSSIILIDTGDGTTRLLTDRTSLNQSPVWSADGRRLYYVSNAQGPPDVYALDVGRNGEPSGEPRRMTTGLGATSISLSGDGKRLIYVEFSQQSNIWSLPIPTSAVSASTATALTSGDQIVESMTVSPDGRWLVYDSNLFGNSDIFRIPVEDGTPERLVEHPADDFVAKLSPDGSAIVFHSWRTGSRDIFVQPLGGQAQQVTDTDSQESYPSWSPTGTALLFFDQLVEDGVTRGLHLVESDNAGGWSEPVLIAPGSGQGIWMADGSIIYALLESGSIEIRPANGGPVRTVYEPRPGSDDPHAGNFVIPSEDERLIYFKAHNADRSAAIWSVPMSGGDPRLLVYFDDPDRPSIRPDFGVGAGRFFFTLEDRRSVIWVVELDEG